MFFAAVDLFASSKVILVERSLSNGVKSQGKELDGLFYVGKSISMGRENLPDFCIPVL